MKITIDTSHDSKEDIKKAIQLLESLSGAEVKVNSDFDSPNDSGTDAFASMFGSAPVTEPKEEPKDDRPASFGVLEELKDKKDETDPKLEFF